MYQADYTDFAQASLPSATTCQVLDFDRFAAAKRCVSVHRFSMRERILAIEWAEASRTLGFSRLMIEPAAECDDGEIREFLLIYSFDHSWASWGIACGADGLTVWQSARGTTIGVFQSLRAAFDVIERLGRTG
jgi:hypothetical protein